MDTPHRLQVPSPRPIVGHVVRAFAQIDSFAKFAMLCVLGGWFFMNTLIVRLGSLQHGVRFFDMWAVIADPARLFFGIDSSFQRICFGLLCLGCLAAPLVSHTLKWRFAWIAYWAPLLLMVGCALLLRSRASAEFLASSADPRLVSGSFIRFADELARQGGLVSRHITVAAGGYIALFGSVVLAVTGMHRLRQRI
jgi:hypothetical protein